MVKSCTVLVVFLISDGLSWADQSRGLVDLQLPPGFVAEHLARAEPEQGSWACLTFDHQGRLLLSAQNGPLMRGTLSKKNASAIRIEPLSIPFSGAQGLLDIDGVLWLNVAQMPDNNGGLWRLVDTDQDDYYDAATRMVRWGNNSEHGPHGLVLGPDGWIWAVNGNYTGAPGNLLDSSAYRNYQHDMLDQIPDPGGHAVGIKEPAGVVYRVSSDGKQIEMVAGGMRNPYDIAFNDKGDLFTYDADMEWDSGTPWYRAPRILHVVSGGEYGWRSGSAKWPENVLDMVPPVVETDVSSPTGIAFGYETNFPEPWRSALFVGDWAYGRILAVEMNQEGATYTGKWRTFMAGRPLNVTDIAVGPDGALYLVTGGRGTRSDLYRVSYRGDSGVGEVEPVVQTDLSATMQRRQLEQLHRQADPRQLEFIWASLDHSDRSVRYAARVAIERLDPTLWAAKINDDVSIDRRLSSLLALVRIGEHQRDIETVLSQLAQISNEQLTTHQRMGLFRTLQVLLSRWPIESDSDRRLILSMIDGSYESSDTRVVFLALDIGVTLEDEKVVGQLLRVLRLSVSQEDQIHAATMLRRVRHGWTEEQRALYFNWLAQARSFDGGRSFGGFLDVIERDARSGLTEAQRADLAEASLNKSMRQISTTPPPPMVRAWIYDELVEHLDRVYDTDRDIRHGEQLFQRAQCLSCHRMNGQGGRQGPDLTGVGGRFSARDILRAIIEPSDMVSDQYRQVTLWLSDGTGVTGRVVGGDTTVVEIDVDPYGNQRERVNRSDIVEREMVPTSSMPSGLVNQLTRKEILDLMAFLLSAGSYDEVGTQND
ncbi:MAG: c-type cytochrome [Phycisphaerales bacterium]|nr:c-type cytochrome [Phycisphaerales bacterium]